MSKTYLKLFGGLLALLIGIVVVSGQMTVTTKSQTSPILDKQTQVNSLNNKGRLARNGDEKAIGDFADEVFNQFAPPEAADAFPLFKDRIVRAEINYRRTGKGGIQEKDVVITLNKLGMQLGTPDYAKVSLRQLRFLRLNALTAFPGLVGQPRDEQARKSLIDSEMSPVEAVGMALLLGNQKLANEDFQVTPSEWATKRQQKEVAKWEAYKGSRPMLDKNGQSVALDGSLKTKELMGLAREHRGEALALVNSSLDNLGIPR